jgi:hypothetical protein
VLLSTASQLEAALTVRVRRSTGQQNASHSGYPRSKQEAEVPMSKSRIASYDWQLLRRRCNARCRQPPLRYCRNWAVRGKTRCKYHGGMSTGPKSPAGKARVVAAMVAGRRRWIERLKAEGKKIPGGRKPGSRIVRPPPPSEEALLAQKAGIKLPIQFRHMTYDEFMAAAKEALKALQER